MTCRVLMVWMLLSFVGCGWNAGPDRVEGPEQALESAKAALRRKDAYGFYDALGDRSARLLFANTLNICLLVNGPEAIKLGFTPIPECLLILKGNGWSNPSGGPYTTEQLNAFIDSVKDLRNVAADLDGTVRRSGSGSSFVWSHLEDVTLKSVVTEGDRAFGIVDWDGEMREIEFERDASGWRVETLAFKTTETDT